MIETDILVIGCGPAGLSAAGYASRAGYEVLAIDLLGPGGQLLYIDEIENYPGSGKTSGFALSEEFEKQATSFGTKIDFLEAKSIKKEGNSFITGTGNDEIKSKAIIYAAGARHRHLEVPGEEEYQGKGVSYCATCDGPFFKGEEIAVVGGGDTALTDALYLSKICSKVHLIHRRTEFRAQKVLQDRVFSTKNIELHLGTNVEKIDGDGKHVTAIELQNGTTLNVKALFVFVGIIPNTEMLGTQIELDHGFIKVNDKMETSLPGFFASGDVRTTPFRQVVTAAGDGAIAAHSADEYIQSL